MGEDVSNEVLFSVTEEWNVIQERLQRVAYQMKLEIKEVLRLLAFPESTMLSPPPRKLPAKGAKKKNHPYTKSGIETSDPIFVGDY